MMKLKYGNAICYSGFRMGQSPITKVYPTYEQVKEDLLILDKNYDYIRMYSPSEHAKTALQVIRNETLSLRVMLGIDLLGEISNPQCTWGGIYTKKEIKDHIKYNEQQLADLIALANEYDDIIFAVSAGNESVPEWNENLVSPERVLYFVKELKTHTSQLVTYCENNNYWNTILTEVAKEVDFISLHTYPVWIGSPIETALDVSISDYKKVDEFYPDKLVIITEAGWPTKANGRGFDKSYATLENHRKYINQMKTWGKQNNILIFFFEAFDEPWKGGDDILEPEKHWGFYRENRTKK